MMTLRTLSKRAFRGGGRCESFESGVSRSFDGLTSGFCTASTQLKRLEGKVALITGAASGIGRATAELFTAEGAKVIVADIEDELGQETAEALGSQADYVHCDVEKESDISAAVGLAISKHGGLDIMFNNVGVDVGPGYASIAELEAEDYDRLMAVNLRGMVLGTKHAARVMIPAKKGSIICTSSVSALLGGLGPHAYTISKHAAIGLVKTVSSELSQHGIRVNSISPFATPTPAFLRSFQRMRPDLPPHTIVDCFNRGSGFRGASFEALDIARAALFLASDDGRYVSGQNLVVDGAFSVTKAFNPFAEHPFSASSPPHGSSS